MLSQARQTPPFPIENPSLGSGRAPLLMSIPVAYYTTLFRPQLWGFFLFEFERGFSFYWCAKIFGLLLASVFLLRQLGIRSRAIVAFGTVWLFFSSFVPWWFSSPAMLPELVASWAMCIGCAIAFSQEMTTRRGIGLAVAGFIFFGLNFVLCLYPPFQIPLVFLGLALLTGFWLEHRKDDHPVRLKRALLLLAGTSAVILLALVPFWLETRATLEVVAQTEYPGGRRSSGGSYSVWRLFAGIIGFFESPSPVRSASERASSRSTHSVPARALRGQTPAASLAAATPVARRCVPELEFLHQLDPQRSFETVYNRYAWIICAVQVFPETAAFTLLQPDFYTMHLPPGLPVLREARYDYYIFPEKWRDALFYDFSLVSKTSTEGHWIYGRNDALTRQR